MWLRPIVCLSMKDHQINLRAPNRYIKEWFEDNYLPVVLQELKNQGNDDFSVKLETIEPPVPTREAPTEEELRKGEEAAEAQPMTWDYTVNPRYTFDTFVVGPSNELSHAAAFAVAEIPAAKYNPLFIYGGVGLGKTHLLGAIGNEIKRREPGFKVASLSSERFMNEYINMLRSNRIDEFRAKYRQHCDVLLIDDIQFIAGKARTQEEFFHTFNSMYDSNRQIVVTSDQYPHEIPELEERLRTRFQWGLIADIQQPEMETRVAILQKKAHVENIELPDEVALFLATNIKSNVRELEGSLIRLAAVASLKRQVITVEFARESLKQFMSQSSPNLTIESIQREVAAHFNIKVSEMRGPKRHKALARPRQIAMYLSRKLTDFSSPAIADSFNRNHATVLHAVTAVETRMGKDPELRHVVGKFERDLCS